jgi:hypothetical protein
VSDSEFDVKGLPSRGAWDSSRGAAGMSMGEVAEQEKTPMIGKKPSEPELAQ